MERLHYQPINQFRVKSGSCEITNAWSLAKVTASSPAIEVMTDLRRIQAATIAHGVSLSETNHSMILRGVRLLFVEDASRRIVGIYEVAGLDQRGEYEVRPLFSFQHQGEEPGTGRVLGQLLPTGLRPSFAEDLLARGYPLPASMRR